MREIGLGAGANFYFRPGKGEHIETAVNIAPEEAAAIVGTVREPDGGTVENALVLLFYAEGGKKLIDRQFTGEDGRFCFGPLEGGTLYQIKVYKNSIKLRELEVIAENT